MMALGGEFSPETYSLTEGPEDGVVGPNVPLETPQQDVSTEEETGTIYDNLLNEQDPDR